MKRFFSAFLAVVIVALLSVTAFAADDVELVFESSYNADTNQVSVDVFVKNPGELTSVDLRLGFDSSVYEFVESEDNSTISDLMIMSGLAVTPEGLVTIAAIFSVHCEESYLIDDRLYLSTFIFTPTTENYDINEFCLWAYSYELNDTDIAKAISAVGNSALMNGKTDDITVADDGDAGVSDNSTNGKWYIYVIAVVLGVAVVAGVAVIAVKSGDKEENDKDEASSSEEIM